MTVAKHKVVQIHYTLRDASGEVIDSSEGGNPLAYIQGIGNLIQGLESQIEGKKVGDSFKAVVEPKDGYGEYQDENVHIVPLSGFQADGDESLEVGMQVRVENQDGISLAEVTAIDGDEVTIDLNHPLAGETLYFDVEIVDVRDATREELDHGHAHGPGGHHHH